MNVFKISVQNSPNERRTNAIRNKIMFLQYRIFGNEDCLFDTFDGMTNNRKLKMKRYIPFRKQGTSLQDISQ
jgi:hypothetical protein